jgi:hypothetical protein
MLWHSASRQWCHYWDALHICLYSVATIDSAWYWLSINLKIKLWLQSAAGFNTSHTQAHSRPILSRGEWSQWASPWPCMKVLWTARYQSSDFKCTSIALFSPFKSVLYIPLIFGCTAAKLTAHSAQPMVAGIYRTQWVNCDLSLDIKFGLLRMQTLLSAGWAAKQPHLFFMMGRSQRLQR